MFGGKLNLSDLLKNASKVQDMVDEAQKELAKIEVEGEAGAGAVRIVMNAKHYVKHITLDPELLKENKITIEELITAAINNASHKIEDITKSKMTGLRSLFGDSEGDKK